MAKVGRVKLGSQGLEVSKQGLGCMGMSAFYGPPKPEDEMIIHHAVESGVTFLDTSDVYGPHTNEVLVGKAIKGIRDKVQLATKFGITRDAATQKRQIHGEPAYVRAALEVSLKRLDVDYIDLYYQHRIDTTVPIEATRGMISSSTSRDHRDHSSCMAVMGCTACARRMVSAEASDSPIELGIGIVAYSPLGRGFFSGLKAGSLSDSNVRKILPRFSEENSQRNQAFDDKLEDIAGRRGKTPGQLALAWVHHKGDDVVPIPGTIKVQNFEDNVGALNIKLSEEEIQEIEQAVPHEGVHGDRYHDKNLTFHNATTPPLSTWKSSS